MDNEFNNNEYNNDENNQICDEYVYETYQYSTNNDQEEDHIDGNTERPAWDSTATPPQKQKKHGGLKWLTCIAMAVVFGLVASVVFQFVSGNIMRFDLSDFREEMETELSGDKTLESTDTATKPSTVIGSDIADVAENVMPSIVSITKLSVQQVQNFFGGIQEYETTSSGSGIIVGKNDTELLIVTNNHVVEGSNTLTVSFIDDASVQAQIKGRDSAIDIAILAVPLTNISNETMGKVRAATIGSSSQIRVGETTIAIGNALGYGQSVTSGIISALNRKIDGLDTKLIQTDAAINPGNSGGALLNAKGEVIGINTVKVNADAVEGMGYAIPTSEIMDVLETLMKRETRTKVNEANRGALGISGRSVSQEMQQYYNMPAGAIILEVSKGSGAEAAKLKKNNIITKIDGISVNSIESLVEQLEYYRYGETVELTVAVLDQNGEYQESQVKVTLQKKS